MSRKRRPSWRLVKTHRNYTVDDAARLLHFAKGTIRRWIKSGGLPALTDRKPTLIVGGDLRDFLEARSQTGPKLRLSEWYCLKCRGPREAALGMADYLPLTDATGNLRALCCQCSTVMHKAISLSSLALLAGVLDIRQTEGPEHLNDAACPSLNDHLSEEPDSHA